MIKDIAAFGNAGILSFIQALNINGIVSGTAKTFSKFSIMARIFSKFSTIAETFGTIVFMSLSLLAVFSDFYF